MQIKEMATGYRGQTILEGLNLETKPGQIIGLVAPNGFGKTTFLRTLVGLHPTSAGKIIYGDADTTKQYYFVPSESYLNPTLSIATYLKYIQAVWHSNRSVEAVTREFKLASYVNLPIRKYSLGMLQMANIALATLSGAPYILLDEPINGLDPSNANLVANLIKRDAKTNNQTFIISSHILENLESMVTDVWFLKDKKIIEAKLSVQPSKTLKKQYEQLFLNSGAK